MRKIYLLPILLFLLISNIAFAIDYQEVQKLVASDAERNNFFGQRVSVSGEYAIVGADGDDDNGSYSGSAYIFYRVGGNWTQQAKLTASDGAENDGFGISVSISGDYAIVGAYLEDEEGSEAGAAYIFHRNGVTWTQQAKLTASDGADDDRFGISVSISGDYAVVGAFQKDENGIDAGAAYVFNRSGVTWTQQAKLTASDGAGDDKFGISVSIFGDYAVVGAYQEDEGASEAGAAYVFNRSGITWTQQAKLTASDYGAQDFFGYSVSICDDKVLIGAYGDDDVGVNSGSAYVFYRSGTSWLQQAKLTAGDSKYIELFGWSVSISDDNAIIGASGDDDLGTKSGSAYIFNKDEGGSDNWGQVQKLLASDGISYDFFGSSVSISAGYAISGAYRESEGGCNSGAAYIFEDDGGPPLEDPNPYNLVLWFDATDIDGDGDSGNNPPGGTPIDNWDDKTEPEEDAVQAVSYKMPLMNPTGINNHPAVQFIYDYGESSYGFSDILESPNETGFHDEITTANPDRWSPDNQSKSFFLLFKPGEVVEGPGDPAPYYSDGRQCVFEVGGPLSGMNTYIANDKICVGAWNRFEQKFFLLDPPGGGFYDNPDNIYYVRYTYDGLDRRIETSVGVFDPADPGATRIYVAEPLSFQGLTRDFTNEITRDDKTGVGGACRTRYHDYNIGETNSDHFGGNLGQVLYYNDNIDPGIIDSFFDVTYDVNFETAPNFPKAGNWTVIEKILPAEDVQLSPAWPNPFTDVTSFSIYLPEKQNIKLELFDSFGNKTALLFEGRLSQGMHDFTIDGASMSSGMYLFRVTGESFVESGKVILKK